MPDCSASLCLEDIQRCLPCDKMERYKRLAAEQESTSGKRKHESEGGKSPTGSGQGRKRKKIKSGPLDTAKDNGLDEATRQYLEEQGWIRYSYVSSNTDQ